MAGLREGARSERGLFAGPAEDDAAAQVARVHGPLLGRLGKQVEDHAVEEAGQSGAVVRSGWGGVSRWPTSTAQASSWSNGGTPVAISAQDAAQRIEVAAVVDLLAADLLRRHVVRVPMARPVVVSREVMLMSWPRRAMPKSQIFTVPSPSRMMLAGLRSRWTMPCRWV